MYTFLFNNDYLLNKNNEAVAVQQQAQTPATENATTQNVTIPISGTVQDTNAKLTAEGNVPVASAEKDTAKGLSVENKTENYINVDLNKLPKKNVFYNTLEQYHKGFKKAPSDEKSDIFAEYLKQVNPEEREALVEKLHEGGQFKEVDEIMINGNNKLGENAVLTNHIALTKSKNGLIKKFTDNMVADHYTEAEAPYQTTILGDIYKNAGKEAKIKAAGHASDVDVKYQVAAHKLTANQGDEDVAAAGAKVSWKSAKENQIEIVKNYKKLNNEKIEKTIAIIEGKYAKENQQPIYKMLMSSKYKSVLKTAANYIHTMDKENQTAAVKMTTDTHCKEAIDAARAHYDEYDSSCKDEISNTLSNATYSDTKTDDTSTQSNSLTTSDSSAETSKTQATTAEISTIKDKFEEIESSNNLNKTQEFSELLNNSNPAEQLALLKTLPAAEAISLASLISNPSLDVIDLITSRASELSSREQNMLADSIGKQYSDKTIASIFPKCSDELQLAYINNSNSTTIFSSINKNTLSVNVRQALKNKNIFEV